MVERSTIVFLNDDYTEMEFVVGVLKDLFGMSEDDAVRAMLKTHREGTCAVATMDRAKAEKIVGIIHERAREAEHPFRCLVQPEA